MRYPGSPSEVPEADRPGSSALDGCERLVDKNVTQVAVVVRTRLWEGGHADRLYPNLDIDKFHRTAVS
jgi:hypothetical protein